jgi:hypothetical protein
MYYVDFLKILMWLLVNPIPHNGSIKDVDIQWDGKPLLYRKPISSEGLGLKDE